MDDLQKVSDEKDDYAQRCHDLDLQVSQYRPLYQQSSLKHHLFISSAELKLLKLTDLKLQYLMADN